MSTATTVPVFDPQGNRGDIPAEQLAAAVKAGGKPGVHITAPDGTPGVIPADRTQEAVKAGAKLIPIEEQPAKDFWSEAGSALWHGISSIPGGLYRAAIDPWLETHESLVAKLHTEQAADAAAEASPERQAHGMVYRKIGVPLAEAVGADVSGMEQGAAEGNPGKVLGTAAVIPTVMATTAGVSKLVGSASKITPAGTKAAAGQILNKVTEAVGDHPVIADEAADVANEILDKQDTGAKLGGVKKPLMKFLDRATDPETPLTFKEAREFEQNLRSLTPAQKMNLGAGVRPLLREFSNKLRLSIEETADAGGVGDDFREGMRHYRLSKMFEAGAEAAKQNAIKTAVGATGATAAGAYGIYKEVTK